MSCIPGITGAALSSASACSGVGVAAPRVWTLRTGLREFPKDRYLMHPWPQLGDVVDSNTEDPGGPKSSASACSEVLVGFGDAPDGQPTHMPSGHLRDVLARGDVGAAAPGFDRAAPHRRRAGDGAPTPRLTHVPPGYFPTFLWASQAMCRGFCLGVWSWQVEGRKASVGWARQFGGVGAPPLWPRLPCRLGSREVGYGSPAPPPTTPSCWRRR